MYRGRIVELGEAEQIFMAPAHPYTVALLSAVPKINPDDRVTRVMFDAESFVPKPLREVRPGHLAAV